jgi:hypothetical protein
VPTVDPIVFDTLADFGCTRQVIDVRISGPGAETVSVKSMLA